ncbi:MAG: tetratricopeptide repeat protein, partial [Candidatus Neomarinimicrobiota bacterium]
QHQVESQYTDALNALVRGDKQKAADILRQVVKQDSNHVSAYLQLGNILRGDATSQAIKIHQSLTVRPNLSKATNIEIHQALARDYEQAEQVERAKSEAEQILRIDRRNKWASEFLLRQAETERNWTEATRLAKQIHRIEGNQDISQLAMFQIYQGLDHLSNKEPKTARACFNKAIKIDPELEVPYYHLGNLEEQDRNLVKALEYWEKYIKAANSDLERVFQKIESALFDLGRFSEVENFYRRMLKHHPKNLEAITKLADVLEEKGEQHSAIALIDQALIADENSTLLKLMKVKLSLKVKQPHELAQQLEDVIETLNDKNHD